MPQGTRRPWRDADSTMLIALWDTVGSVALIAIMLQRSRSSVQTQASRKGLPPRTEDSDRHRRRWMEGDDERLEELLVELTQQDGSIPIQELAEKMGRSVDAVVARIEASHGEESDVMARLVAPPVPLTAAEVKPAAVDPKRKGKVKTCLNCRNKFWSEGNHNWVCITCKRGDDWSFDY
jgi:hypothetical protein